MAEEKKNDVSTDKYKDKSIRFEDKGNYYELIFTDDFNIPSSGTMFNGKSYMLITDIVTDMRNANHDKELHIFISSFGGAVHALNMIFQCALEFKYRVAINMGMADSCGWMPTFICQERYGSPWCEYMYHEMSMITFGKTVESKNQTEFASKWWKELLEKTYTHEVLTAEERKLGETSEVWFTGAELIKRGAIKDYSEYKDRKAPANSDCLKVGDSIYVKDGDKYILYKKDKDKKKIDYCELLKEVNKK